MMSATISSTFSPQALAASSPSKKTDKSKIKEWERQIQELGEEAAEVINEVVETIIGGTAEDIAKELGDAFIEAFFRR